MEKMQWRKLSRREIQKKELAILLYVQQFCQKNQIKFYLAGGTLLGAIRHKGFIPWDDDIDICMPRPDYERFVSTFSGENKNLIIISNRLGNWGAPFAKVVDLSITVKSQFHEDETHLWIDVFPIDGLPKDRKNVANIYKKVSFLRRVYLLGNARLGEGKKMIYRRLKYILKPLVRAYGVNRLSKMIEAIAMKFAYEDSEYVGAVTWGLYGVGERMLKAEFEKSVLVEFEGHQFPAMSCWDSYLTGIYGDYMQLPPIEKRKTHDMSVYVVNN